MDSIFLCELLYRQTMAYSLTEEFLSPRNRGALSRHVGRDVSQEARQWAAGARLDDYESVQGSRLEELQLANRRFVGSLGPRADEWDESWGQKYPGRHVEGQTSYFGVDQMRAIDAQLEQVVVRTNANFRYNNRIPGWEAALYRRHYDRDAHPEGLKDIRSLEQAPAGYDLSGVFEPSRWTSADSHLWNDCLN
jgi:hypothetical protein